MPRSPAAAGPVDVVLGASVLTARAAVAAARRARPLVEPMARTALDPPLLPETLHPGHWLRGLARQGRARRGASTRDLAELLDALVPAVLEAVLERADLTALVKRYVDLDSVVASVDLDAAAKRLDVDAVVADVDLDAAAARLDVDAVARRLDVDAVARRLDLAAVLDRLDLTAEVLGRVDLDVLVRAVLDRIDLPVLAEQVIDAVDLPEIIRESTGSMASDTVRGARMQGIAGDEAVGRLRDRLLLRRNHGRDQGGADPGGAPGAAGTDEPAGVPTQRTEGR